MSLTLLSLPDELIHAILLYADAEAVIALQQTCRRFSEVTTSAVLWRSHCLQSYQFWDESHDISRRVKEAATATPWKDMYSKRRMVDVVVTGILDNIIRKMHARIRRYRDILTFGYDAKDILLRHAQVGHSHPDFLARRYWSLDILRFLNRGVALSSWQKLRDGEHVSLEHALAAFDMLVLGNKTSDLQDIDKILESIAQDLLLVCPRISQYTPRNQALCIVEYLHSKNLTGIATTHERAYYALEHNFLSIALKHPDHNSLPLISAAIYCSLAGRFDLDAHPCSFPLHVLVIVRPRPGIDLNGRAIGDDKTVEPMYLDPCCTPKEIPVQQLQRQLDALENPRLNLSVILQKASVREIVLRCGKNIMNSISELGGNAQQDLDSPVDWISAKYAAFWSYILFFDYTSSQHHPATMDGSTGQLILRSILPPMLHSILAHFPSDIHFLKKHILPLIVGADSLSESLQSLSDNAQASDCVLRPQKKRDTDETLGVRYKIGQVFVHSRYGYRAVITGWKMQTKMGESGRLHHTNNHTVFYHAVSEDKSKRYVSQDSIRPVYPEFSELPKSFFDFAGRYFKTWHPVSRAFVSNIRDEYPDD